MQLCDNAIMTLVLAAAALYLSAASLVARRLARDHKVPVGFWLLTALSAVVLHALHHLLVWRQLGAPDLHFFAAISLVGLSMGALTTLYAGNGRMGALGVVVFPLAAAALLGHAVMVTPVSQQVLGWRLELHVWLALLAYATLAIAALLALMLWVQERALRQRKFHRWLRLLPPLTELESLMFRTIAVGFVLLTATLLTGVVFIEDFLRQRLPHKTVLSVLSWLTFGALLLGRWRRGWRGTRAVHWTLSAMGLLLLAYFGSKFVYELVLQRGTG